MPWTIEFHESAEAEFLALPEDVKAKFERIKRLIDGFGLERLPAKYARHARALYVTRAGQRVIVVRVFTKKTQKTPRREISVAIERAKEVG